MIIHEKIEETGTGRCKTNIHRGTNKHYIALQKSCTKLEIVLLITNALGEQKKKCSKEDIFVHSYIPT